MSSERRLWYRLTDPGLRGSVAKNLDDISLTFSWISRNFCLLYAKSVAEHLIHMDGL